MAELIDIINSIAQGNQAGQKPADIAIGTVIQPSPLSIQIDGSMQPIPAAGLIQTVGVVAKTAQVQGGEGGTVVTENDTEIPVKLTSGEISAETNPSLHSSAITVIAENADGYTLAGIWDIRVVKADDNTIVPVNGAVNILISYPAGYNAGNDFVIYHNYAAGAWEEITILDKTEQGILCTVNSLSPFAVAVKDENVSEPPSTDVPGGGSSSNDTSTSSGNSSSSASSPSGASGNTNNSSAESIALTDIPQTGDAFPMILLSVLFVASAAVWAVTYEKRKKER